MFKQLGIVAVTLIIIPSGAVIGSAAVETNTLEEVTQLDDMVVTGTRTEKKLSDVPVRTELVKRQEIEETAALTLADAVEFTSGVRVENNCQNCNFSQLRLLGMDGAYSQVLIDGQPLMSSMAAVYGLEHIPARYIDRIEIIKGGGSALYGPGAVAGVINVIPRDPTESGGEFDARYDYIDGADARAFSGLGDVVSENEKTRFSAMGQINHRNPYDRDGDGFSELGHLDFRSGGIRMRRFLKNNANLTLDYSHIFEDRRGGDLFDQPEFKANIAESVQTTRDVASVTWSQAASDKMDYRVTGSLAMTDRDSYYGSGMDPNAYGFSENPFYSLDTQFNHYHGSHTLTWGAQGTQETLEDTQPAYSRTTDETYNNVGLYVQDDWAISETVSFVPGARVDKHSEVKNAILSPRLALRWAPDPYVNVRTSFATGFRPPQIFDEDLHITQVGGEGKVIRNASNLKEESSTSYTLGAEWTPPLGPGFGLLEGTLFYTQLRDAFSVDKADDPGTTNQIEFLRTNRGGARVYGAEMNIGYKTQKRFEAVLGYVCQRSRFDDADSEYGRKEFFRTPDNYGVLKLTWKNPKCVDVFLGAKYTGSMLVPHEAGFISANRLETTESFLTWDLSVSKVLPVEENFLKVVAGIKNITDEYQSDLDRGASRDSAYVYGPRYPRTYYASLKYLF